MTDPDVLVLGGGPAGVAAAVLLARRSHRVTLVRPASTPAGDLGVSVPPSARRILEELGLSGAVDAARFEPNLGNRVWWARRPGRTERFEPPNAGFHADRTSLERVLVAAADAIGVNVLPGTTARSARFDDGAWTVRCSGADGEPLDLRAPWVVDATGRHGFLARDVRQPDRSTTTLALLRHVRREGGWGEDLRGITLIESYAEGWAWSVPLSESVRCVAAMIDQRDADLAGLDAGRMFDRETARTEGVAGILAAAQPAGDAWACPASLYTSFRFARPGLLLAGDAGSFIDPLSSYGVKKALASGWLAGVAAHTALTDPGSTGLALDFFDGRERALYRSYRATSAAFFGQAAEAWGTEYWRRRAAAAEAAGGSLPGEAGGDPRADAGAEDRPAVPESDVRAAFEALRSRERLEARRGDDVRELDLPTVRGHRVVLATHLATGRVPEGIRYARNVDLDVVVRLAPEHDRVSDLWDAYNRHAPPVPLPDFLTGLSTAFAAGLLVHGE